MQIYIVIPAHAGIHACRLLEQGKSFRSFWTIPAYKLAAIQRYFLIKLDSRVGGNDNGGWIPVHTPLSLSLKAYELAGMTHERNAIPSLEIQLKK